MFYNFIILKALLILNVVPMSELISKLHILSDLNIWDTWSRLTRRVRRDKMLLRTLCLYLTNGKQAEYLKITKPLWVVFTGSCQNVLTDDFFCNIIEVIIYGRG